MKIKTDFITNSSTTVQIVHVPPGLKISKEDVKRLDDYKELPLDELCIKVENYLADLTSGGSLSPDWDLGGGGAYSVLTQYLEEKGFTIKDIDVGGSEGTYLINISEKDIQDLIINISSSKLSTLFKDLEKGTPITKGE